MKRFSAWLLLSLSGIAFAAASHAQEKPKAARIQQYDDADGYQVVSAILNSSTERSNAKTISIYAYTAPAKTIEAIMSHCEKQMPDDFQDAKEDLLDRSAARFRLDRKFSIRADYRLVNAPVRGDGGTYAEGIFSISAVGFDRTRTRAIVLVEHLIRPNGSLAVGGSSIFYLLRKSEKGWHVVEDVQKCGRVY